MWGGDADMDMKGNEDMLADLRVGCGHSPLVKQSIRDQERK